MDIFTPVTEEDVRERDEEQTDVRAEALYKKLLTTGTLVGNPFDFDAKFDLWSYIKALERIRAEGKEIPTHTVPIGQDMTVTLSDGSIIELKSERDSS